MAMKTIRVSEEIHTKLSHLGLKSETYNDIIGRLISAYEEQYLDDLTDDTKERNIDTLINDIDIKENKTKYMII